MVNAPRKGRRGKMAGGCDAWLEILNAVKSLLPCQMLPMTGAHFIFRTTSPVQIPMEDVKTVQVLQCQGDLKHNIDASTLRHGIVHPSVQVLRRQREGKIRVMSGPLPEPHDPRVRNEHEPPVWSVFAIPLQPRRKQGIRVASVSTRRQHDAAPSEETLERHGGAGIERNGGGYRQQVAPVSELLNDVQHAVVREGFDVLDSARVMQLRQNVHLKEWTCGGEGDARSATARARPLWRVEAPALDPLEVMQWCRVSPFFFMHGGLPPKTHNQGSNCRVSPCGRRRRPPRAPHFLRLCGNAAPRKCRCAVRHCKDNAKHTP